MKTFVYRGTPVTCARDVADLLYAAGQDLTFSKVRIGSDMLVNASIYNAVRRNWVKIAGHVLAAEEVRFVGHSLGACHALASPSFLPRSVAPRVFAFAPFQFANQKFHAASYAARPMPRTYGRTGDFAPGWDHLDPETALAGPIDHLTGNGVVVPVTSWPAEYESVSAHDVDLYASDLSEVEDGEEATLMCRLASASYTEVVGDMITKFAGLGFRVLDVVEAPGFRCVVSEEDS